ncbi:hypothetical protein BGZ60DRAFT_109594 [Tricladium varicosporioides]|nr:hypothetical protein BGZ60DRAFT_109594 [Hymenoscyphus varicosporioides]
MSQPPPARLGAAHQRRRELERTRPEHPEWPLIVYPQKPFPLALSTSCALPNHNYDYSSPNTPTPFVAENWLPDFEASPWSANGGCFPPNVNVSSHELPWTSDRNWSHDSGSFLMPATGTFEETLPHPVSLYPASETNMPFTNLGHQSASYVETTVYRPLVGPNPERNPGQNFNLNQQLRQPRNSTGSSYSITGSSPTSHQPLQTASKSILEHNSYSSVPGLNVAIACDSSYSSTAINKMQENIHSWPLSATETEGSDRTSVSPLAKTLPQNLEWQSNDPIPSLVRQQVQPTSSISKRKRTSPEPTEKRSKAAVSQDSLSEFVLVFENAPGALSSVKHRRKLDAPVRKAARDVRKAGACHQCRFRKRTCSTGTPCVTCLKNGNGLHELKCQRESPFVGKLMHQYFDHSSTRRVVSFAVDAPIDGRIEIQCETITIDGIGRISHPIKLRAQIQNLSALSPDQRSIILKTGNNKQIETANEDEMAVLLLEANEDLGRQIEQWAMEYTSKFVHAAGERFHSTTMAQILGTAYVRKKLPESKLVAAMLRVSSIAFVLRAGVKPDGAYPKGSRHFRTIQARVDTLLYERLKYAEKDLFSMLQRLIFRTAGCLSRNQVYPVALVLWQLMRILSISSSHLSNIAQRFQSKGVWSLLFHTLG